MVAIEAAIAAQPDTAERIRGGNIPAAGALIGAVMKATGGQAEHQRSGKYRAWLPQDRFGGIGQPAENGRVDR